jgi:hypothetical protein
LIENLLVFSLSLLNFRSRRHRAGGRRNESDEQGCGKTGVG